MRQASQGMCPRRRSCEDPDSSASSQAFTSSTCNDGLRPFGTTRVLPASGASSTVPIFTSAPVCRSSPRSIFHPVASPAPGLPKPVRPAIPVAVRNILLDKVEAAIGEGARTMLFGKGRRADWKHHVAGKDDDLAIREGALAMADQHVDLAAGKVDPVIARDQAKAAPGCKAWNRSRRGTSHSCENATEAPLVTTSFGVAREDILRRKCMPSLPDGFTAPGASERYISSCNRKQP